MNAANMKAKEAAEKLMEADKTYSAALRDCNATEALKAAELYDLVCATRKAARARDFAAALQKAGENG